MLKKAIFICIAIFNDIKSYNVKTINSNSNYLFRNFINSI